MVWQEEDEVRRAAKSFAQMFNGQIVNLDSDMELLPGIEASPVLQAAAAIDSTDADDDDDDVPF
jgi:DNA polymerase-3 subunit gamma/tau